MAWFSFTDFLVYEVDKSGQVVHLKSIEPPSPTAGLKVTPKAAEPEPAAVKVDEMPTWSLEIQERLKPYFSEDALVEFQKMYTEGQTPPLPPATEGAAEPAAEGEPGASTGGGPGGKAGKQKRGPKKKKVQEDTRKVTSEVRL